MIETRIKVARDKANLVKELKISNNPKSPFSNYVDIIIFAAVLGARRNKRVPLSDFSKAEPAPIPREQFINNGYDTIINLLAVCGTKQPSILAYNQDSKDECQVIFEEYANGGLEILQDELRGVVDYSEQILLFLLSEKLKVGSVENEFDLSKFLS